MALTKIPKSIANKCPDKCPICNKPIFAVFRSWAPRINIVTVDFCHKKTECTKKYLINLKNKNHGKKTTKKTSR